MRKQNLNMKTNESFSRQILLVFFSLLMPLLAHAEPIEINGIWYNLFDDTEQAEVTFNPIATLVRMKLAHTLAT